MNWITQSWPWWVSGILIGLTVPLLYILAGKAFGISTSLQEAGAMCAPNSKLEYLSKFDRKANLWTLVFALGIAHRCICRHVFPVERTGSTAARVIRQRQRRNQVACRRVLHRLRDSLCRRMHVGPFDYRHLESQLAQSRGDDLLFRWRPRRHVGTWPLDLPLTVKDAPP